MGEDGAKGEGMGGAVGAAGEAESDTLGGGMGPALEPVPTFRLRVPPLCTLGIWCRGSDLAECQVHSNRLLSRNGEGLLVGAGRRWF